MIAIAVEPIELGHVELPAGHPRGADGTCPIRGFVLRHPDGVILVDTGVADDHDRINELYRPTSVPIVDALGSAGVDERDVVAIVNTHLHFDHCGQNRAFPTTPVWVQAADYALVDAPRYTVPDWARITDERRRLVDGDAEIAAGVRLVATPGHTPGHQSVVVESGITTIVVAGQCTYTCAEFEAGAPLAADMHDDSWLGEGRASVARLRAIGAEIVHLSHDRTILRRTT